MLSNYRRKTTLIENADLRNSAITINGSSTSLGGSISVGTVTSVATSAPITGGTITSTGTIGITQSTTSTDGYLSSTDWNTFNNKASTASVALKLNISDTATMLSNYRRKTTLIENADLRNSAITINGSSTSLGGSINVGTVTSVSASAGTGISVSGSPITTSGTLTITNTAPDQTVTLTAGSGISVTGTYPNFTVTNSSPSSGGTVTSVSAGIGMSFTTITSTGAVNADTTTLATRAYAAGLDVAKANTNLNNVNGVLSSTYGGAGIINGILKANGSGVVSAAVNNSDFTLLNGTGFVRMSGTTPSYLTGASSQFVKADGSLDGNTYATTGALSGYLPLSAGSGQPLSGILYITKNDQITQMTATTGTSRLFNQYNNTGGSFYYGLNSSTGAGLASGGLAYSAGLSTGNNTALQFGTNNVFRYTIDGSGNHNFGSGTATFGGALSGTSLSMSGEGLFGGAVTNGTDKLIVAGSGLFTSSISSTRGVFNNSTQSQLEIFGWNNIQGASTNAGEIRFGGITSIQGRLIYSSAGNSTLYLDNTFDNANAEIKLRTRVSGTAVDALTLTSTAATFSSSVTASSLIKSGGTSTQSLIADGSVQTLTSGIYTLTITNTSNITSTTARTTTYTRVGNTVTVSGWVTITTTSNEVATEIGVSLPIASAFTAAYDLSGSGFY